MRWGSKPATGRSTLRVGRVSACAVACLLVSASSAAAGTARRIHVDTGAFPSITVSVVLPPGSTAPTVTENGLPVHVTYASNVGRASTIALVVDHSRSMHGPALRKAVAVARRLLAGKHPRDRVALFSVAAKAAQLTRFSRSTSVAARALGTLHVPRRYGTALYDAVILAAHALARQPGHSKVILLVSDGQETTSTHDITAAVAAANRAGVPVYPVAIANPTYRPGLLNGLARATRGAFFGGPTRSPASAAALAVDVANTWRIEYTTALPLGESLVVRVSRNGSPPVRALAKIPAAPPAHATALTRAPIVIGVLAVIGLMLVLLAIRRRRAVVYDPPRSSSR